MLRVLIVDDHEIVRHGVRDLVNSHLDWEICGEAGDGHTAYELAISTNPDVIVLDIAMAQLNGLTLARMLHRELPAVKVLLFTMLEDRASVNAALAAGVRGYVLKSDPDAQLATAIAALGEGRLFFSPSIAEMVVDAAVNGKPTSCLAIFSARELEVSQLMAEGYGNKAIARALDLSVKTVESHRASALRKAGVHTAAELVRFAIRHNLIKP